MRALITLILVFFAAPTIAATYQLNFEGSSEFLTYYAPNQDARIYGNGPIEHTSDGSLYGGRFVGGQNSRVTMQDDSLFSVSSISLGEYSHVFNGQQLEVTFAGRKADNSLVYQSFFLDGVMQGEGDAATPLFEDFSFSSEFENLQAFYMMNISDAEWANADYYPEGGGWEDYYRRTGVNNWQYFIAPGDMPEAFNANPFSVQSLNVTYVPVPAAAWLFGSALMGLGWLRRKQSP